MDIIIIDGLSFALPLFLIALGGLYCERSGVINLALEGLLGFGAFTGGLFVILMTSKFVDSPQTLVYLALLMATLGGMVYSMLFALLCVKLKANQIIAGVVINILSISITAFLTSQINRVLTDRPSNKFVLGVSERITIPGLSEIPIIGAFFTNLYPFEIIIVVVALVAWYVLYKTKFGLQIRACGENPHAVDAAGLNVEKIRFKAIMISGALAGLGGMCFAYSISANFSSNIYSGFGYLALAGLIFGNWRILPTFFACMLFGFAKSGGYELVKKLELSSTYSDLALILPYLLTLLLLIFFSKNNAAPKALGEVYDKGKR